MRSSIRLTLCLMAGIMTLLPGIVVRTSAQGEDLAAAPRISQTDFKKDLSSGRVLVLDVRDAASYALGHIPGAISMPLDELSKHVSELKGEKRAIVAYCA